MSTNIEWTDRVWNPVTGCTKVSAGCKNCYAEGVANRFFASQYPEVMTGRHDASQAAPEVRPRKFTDVMTHADRLIEPLRWRKPGRVFVNSMSDLFHEDVPFEFLDRVFAVMALTPYTTYQILTKRPELMREYLAPGRQNEIVKAVMTRLPERDRTAWLANYDGEFPLPNVWLGVSVENQETADQRIPQLLDTPAEVRFVSYEPALGPVDFGKVNLANGGLMHSLGGTVVFGDHDASSGPSLDWVIVGGESGPSARPCDVAWIRSTVAQCKAAGVACFVKQTGSESRGFCEWEHHDECPPEILDEHGCNKTVGTGSDWQLRHAVDDAFWPCRPKLKDRKGGDPSEWSEDLRVREFPAVSR